MSNFYYWCAPILPAPFAPALKSSIDPLSNARCRADCDISRREVSSRRGITLGLPNGASSRVLFICLPVIMFFLLVLSPKQWLLMQLFLLPVPEQLGGLNWWERYLAFLLVVTGGAASAAIAPARANAARIVVKLRATFPEPCDTIHFPAKGKIITMSSLIH